MSDELDDLIQRVLDGEATPAERERFAARLAADPGLRRRHGELASAFRAVATATLAEPPAGLRDDILRTVRAAPEAKMSSAATPGSARARVDAVRRWPRLVLPAGAIALALAVLWVSGRLPGVDGARERVAGTMSGRGTDTPLSLGSGASAVLVSGHLEGTGFTLRVRAGSVPAHVEVAAATPGTLLGGTPVAAATGGPRFATDVPAGGERIVHGLAPGGGVVLFVTARFPGGETTTRPLRLGGPSSRVPPAELPPEPTSAPPKGH